MSNPFLQPTPSEHQCGIPMPEEHDEEYWNHKLAVDEEDVDEPEKSE